MAVVLRNALSAQVEPIAELGVPLAAIAPLEHLVFGARMLAKSVLLDSLVLKAVLHAPTVRPEHTVMRECLLALHALLGH